MLILKAVMNLLYSVYSCVYILMLTQTQTHTHWPTQIDLYIHIYIYIHAHVFRYTYVYETHICLRGFASRMWVYSNFHFLFCPVGWSWKIHRLLLCRRVTPPSMNVLHMTQNNLMLRSQLCRSFRECGKPFHSHRSLVHSGPVCQRLIGSYPLVK